MDQARHQYPEVNPYLQTYLYRVSPRREAARWFVEPQDIWDLLGDFA